MGLDGQLIFRLQFLASRLASLLLDGAGLLSRGGIYHVREGVLLSTPDARFMTEEACSGVRSLFSTLALLSIYSVSGRHRLPRFVINVVQAIFWVIIGNAVRVAATVYLADRYDPWFATGTGHMIIGYVVLAGILAMVLNVDALIGQVLFPGSRWYREPDDEWDGDDRRSRSQGRSGDVAVGQSLTAIAARYRPGVTMPLTALLAIAAALGVFIALASDRAIAPVSDDQRLPVLAEADLPEMIGDWRRGKFEVVHRDVDSMLADDSFTWQYVLPDAGDPSKASILATVSVDCPWNEWHNLNLCYVAIGWQTNSSYFKASPAGVPWDHLRYSELAMSRPNSQQTGRVLFTAVDAARREVVSNQWRYVSDETSRWWSIMLEQIGETLGWSDAQPIRLPATTIQLYCEHPDALTAEQTEALRAFFFDVRDRLLQTHRWGTPQT